MSRTEARGLLSQDIYTRSNYLRKGALEPLKGYWCINCLWNSSRRRCVPFALSIESRTTSTAQHDGRKGRRVSRFTRANHRRYTAEFSFSRFSRARARRRFLLQLECFWITFYPSSPHLLPTPSRVSTSIFQLTIRHKANEDCCFPVFFCFFIKIGKKVSLSHNIVDAWVLTATLWFWMRYH